MEWKFEINQYVTTALSKRNGRVIDRRRREKRGLLQNVYLVDFSLTHQATIKNYYGFKLEYWFVESELKAHKPLTKSYFEIWLDAIIRLIKNVTGYEFNR